MEFENNLWSKEIKFQHDVMIMMDDDIELVFVNSRPVDVNNQFENDENYTRQFKVDQKHKKQSLTNSAIKLDKKLTTY